MIHEPGKPPKISEVPFRETSIFKGKVDMDSVHESVVPARLSAGCFANHKKHQHTKITSDSLVCFFLNI